MMRSSDNTAMPRKLFKSIEEAVFNFTYRGISCLKNPFDLALLSMLFWKTQPATIIEWGSFYGASALWMVDTCRSMGLDTRCYSYDKYKPLPLDDRIEFKQGDVRDPGAACPVEFISALPRPILVLEDTDHTEESTSSILNYFGPLLEAGEYIIIEDVLQCYMSKDPLIRNGGPRAAIDKFMLENEATWECDRTYCDWFGYNITWNANGFLRRRGKSAFRENVTKQKILVCYSPDGDIKWTEHIYFAGNTSDSLDEVASTLTVIRT